MLSVDRVQAKAAAKAAIDAATSKLYDAIETYGEEHALDVEDELHSLEVLIYALLQRK